jgi:hypothetical protein
LKTSNWKKPARSTSSLSIYRGGEKTESKARRYFELVKTSKKNRLTKDKQDGREKLREN